MYMIIWSWDVHDDDDDDDVGDDDDKNSNDDDATLYMIIWSWETLIIPPATDQRNIIGSIVRVVIANSALKA